MNTIRATEEEKSETNELKMQNVLISQVIEIRIYIYISVATGKTSIL